MKTVTHKQFSQAYKIVVLYHPLPQTDESVNAMVGVLSDLRNSTPKAIGPDECKAAVRAAGFNIEE